MRNLRQLAVILAVPALLAFTLVACGDDDDDGDVVPTATDVVAPLPTDANGGGDGDGGAAPTATDAVAPLPTDADGGGDGDGDVDGDTLQLEVTSASISFAPDALEAAAGEDFRIVYANVQDGVSHNFAIFASEDDATGGGDPIAATTVKNGADTQELLVAGLAAGDYFIWCEIHTSSMTATLTVQ